MPIVEVTRSINAPAEAVYALAKDVEKFPEIMPDVESVQVLERDGNVVVARWVGVIKQFNRKITWTERDVWDDENRTCRFEQIEGDYDKFEGIWEFQDDDGQVDVTLRIDYEMNVPLIGALIKNIILKLMRQNCEGMLESLGNAAEAARHA